MKQNNELSPITNMKMWNYYNTQIVPDPVAWVKKTFGNCFSTNRTRYGWGKEILYFEKPYSNIIKHFYGVEHVDLRSLRSYDLSDSYRCQFNIGFIFDKQLYSSSVIVDVGQSNYTKENILESKINDITVFCPSKVTEIPEEYINLVCCEDNLKPLSRLEKDMPYAHAIQYESAIPVELFYCFPAIELLYKAGYAGFCKKIVESYKGQVKADIQRIKRLCKNGHDLKSIFTTSKALYNVAREKDISLQIFDEMRKLEKIKSINKDALLQVAESCIVNDKATIQNFRYVLNFTHDGKSVFTFESLMNKLRRLDMYEALETKDALQYMADYLRNCSILVIAPRINSDSLLREHNVTSRLVRERAALLLNEKIEGVCEQLQKYDWSKGGYFVRAIRDNKDLLDEATQQRNCVAAYSRSIATGSSKIFVVRRCADPGKSLITIETSADMNSIRQAYLAQNREVTSTAQQNFIKDWLNAIRNGETNDWNNLPNELSYQEKCTLQDKLYKEKYLQKK